MLVYRIAKAKYAFSLVASGGAARWNSSNKFVIYTAASRALACLENIVHFSGEGQQGLYRVMVIEIPEDIVVQHIGLKDLPKNWFRFESYPECQLQGNQWLSDAKSAILSVPSAIIQNEINYLINPLHADFVRIKLLDTEPFAFDPRFARL